MYKMLLPHEEQLNGYIYHISGDKLQYQINNVKSKLICGIEFSRSCRSFMRKLLVHSVAPASYHAVISYMPPSAPQSRRPR